MGRRRGFGYLRKLPSGRIQASYIGPDQMRHNAPVTFTADVDANAWLVGEHRLMERDEWTPPAARALAAREEAKLDELTLRAFVKGDWESSLEVRASTKRDYDGLLKNHILPALGDEPIRSLTKGKVRSWRNNLDKSKPRARAKAFQLLHGILAVAMDFDIITSNPATLPAKTKGRTGKSAKTVVPLTLEQLNTLADAMPPRLRVAVLLGCWCSLRYGELSELRRSDIFLDDEEIPAELRDEGIRAPVLHISRGVVKVKGGYVSGEPKTAAGNRWVHIPPSIATELRKHLLAHAAGGVDGLLFPAANGGYLHSTSFARAFHTAAATAGRPDATPHLLRHTGVSLAAKAGATTRENMARTGHSTPAMSLHYEHALNGADAALSDRLDALARGGVR